MALITGSFIGNIITQVLKGFVEMFRNWYTERKLTEETTKRKALESYHEAAAAVRRTEETIAAAGLDEELKAISDAENTKHQVMLEHLRKHNS